jgi:hypothetical protein
MVLAGNNNGPCPCSQPPVRGPTRARRRLVAATGPDEDEPMGLSVPNEALILLAVVFLLSGVLRRFFGSQNAAADRKLARARDYGLLAQVATAPSERAAEYVRDLLRRNGIRATTVPGEDGTTRRVLVFPKDASTAAAILLREP